MQRGLFVGRFQPFHKGHLQDVKDALKEVDELIIAIGSSKEKGTRDNPFSAAERRDMIVQVLAEEKIRKCTIMEIPDFHDDEKWVRFIEENFPKIDIAYTGNEWTEKCFKSKGCKVKKVNILENISSTTIRNRMLSGKNWRELVPADVAEYIDRIKGVERIKFISKNYEDGFSN